MKSRGLVMVVDGDAALGSPPVLLMTSASDRGRAGADLTIDKPFQLVDFGDKLLRLVRQHAPRSATHAASAPGEGNVRA